MHNKTHPKTQSKAKICSSPHNDLVFIRLLRGGPSIQKLEIVFPLFSPPVGFNFGQKLHF